MRATTYQKHLSAIVQQQYAGLSAGQLIDKLFEIGVVDQTRCKVLAVRQHVEQLVKEGEGKVNAMWIAAGKFSCSYEYVRKCMYYYRDVHL